MMSPDIDVRTIAPALGVGTSEPDYLDYDIKGRGYLEKMFFNAGTAFLGGMCFGGVYGAVQGYRATPHPAFRVRTNAFLNGFGKTGSNLGNGAGACALMYTTFEYFADQLKIDDALGVSPIVNSVSAGVATGMLYKCTAGPRAVVLAGVIGGAFTFAMETIPSLLRGY